MGYTTSGSTMGCTNKCSRMEHTSTAHQWDTPPYSSQWAPQWGTTSTSQQWSSKPVALQWGTTSTAQPWSSPSNDQQWSSPPMDVQYGFSLESQNKSPRIAEERVAEEAPVPTSVNSQKGVSTTQISRTRKSGRLFNIWGRQQGLI
ncbi:unnamed protein product [Eruca vesicaria subsp. sativa]|uniref:Uncharacterized protein n=1 Tax=Eruca vesicaria subsp. sativa TaxID=29727 RepID=A0ABC8K8U4_ERUVS|nr:unnamed protein product [Eruca vesicaria subsp. sativa]